MKKIMRTFWIIIVIILNIAIFGSLLVPSTVSTPKLSQTAPMKNVIIDGIINETEWADRDWTISFFLDVDDVGNPPDKDGTNYLYLGEDLSYFYIALDLCSDQTNNITDEWISLWLNIANRSFNNYEDWAKYLNNGTESLIYDVGNDKTWQFFDYGITYSKPVDFNDNNEIIPINGNVWGDYTQLDSTIIAPPYYTITSGKNGSDYIAWIDFSIDMKKWFPVLPGIFTSDVDKVNFDLWFRINTTITENKLILWYSNETINVNDPNQVRPMGVLDGFTISETFWYDKGNITADHKIQFSLYANHSAPFNISLAVFEFKTLNHIINSPQSSVSYPFSSLIDFDLAWGFNVSPNSVTNHRMFEFKVPKSSLEHYDSDKDIGIMIGGYGTLSFPNTSYWVYSKYIDEITEEQSKDYYYFNMLGIEFPLTERGGAIFGYNSLLIIGIIGISSVIIIKRKLKTD
ncbi:MAG: hypothetical protein ACW98X_01780 [Promethearchaeota archaeon]|jgi:hypothetical protein